MGADLLPRNATAFERALSLASARPEAIPAPLRPLWRPHEIREDLLPWLAWTVSTDVWDDTWPIEKKRWVVATEIERHRRKGTLAGIRAYLSLLDMQVLRVRTPPSSFFLSRSYTAEERVAFLSRYPQIRIRPFAPLTAPGPRFYVGTRSYPGKKLYPRRTWNGRGFRRDAVLWDAGVETPLTWRENRTETYGGTATAFDEIVLPGIPHVGFHPGSGPKPRIFMGPPGAPARTVSVAVNRSYSFRLGAPIYRTVTPGLTPISVDPVMQCEPGEVMPGAFASGQTLRRRFLRPSRAWQRIYETIYLHDPERAVRARGGWSFLGHVRLGMPAYTAEIEIAATRRLPRSRFGRFVCGHLLAPDTSHVAQACRAVRVAKAARDRILADFRTRAIVTPADRPPIGTGLGALVRR